MFASLYIQEGELLNTTPDLLRNKVLLLFGSDH